MLNYLLDKEIGNERFDGNITVRQETKVKEEIPTKQIKNNLNHGAPVNVNNTNGRIVFFCVFTYVQHCSSVNRLNICVGCRLLILVNLYLNACVYGLYTGYEYSNLQSTIMLLLLRALVSSLRYNSCFF